MAASREASLALACVVIVNVVLFLAFDAQTTSQAVLQVSSIILWFALSKVSAFQPIYSKISKLWYQLRIYIRIGLIAIGIYFMIQNRMVRMLLSGFFSFKGIAFFGRHRIRVRLVSDNVEDFSMNKGGKTKKKL